ncbi:MAG: PDZ domain-containing protein [Candidatus Obscuribacterales bacterium]|nr:PDZ domain-containing protein [Candidatus Obscuribacterales bacterium]
MLSMKRAGSCFVALLSLFCTVYQPAQGGYKLHPRDVYHKAWELVRDTYYEPTFNNQNWAAWEHKYDADIRTVADAHKDIKVMLESLKDPYTRFLDPQSFKDESDAINAKIVGIGINLVNKDGHLVVTKTIDNSPAQNAGMQQKDEIVAIDGQNAVGFTPEQAAEKIRGKAGTAVQIAVRRGDSEKKFDITRAEITIHAVSYKVLDHNIGYIQLSTFISNDAAREFKTALEKLSRTDGLIVDLRDNPGGLLSNSLEIADMLLDGGVIVSTVGRNGRSVDTASGNPVSHQPIAVLVDDESASASEILAGALKDNQRATIIGTHTYGKGLVQEINHLPGGAAVHITVSKYLTPAGTDINQKGVQPDILVSDKEQQDNVAITFLKEKIASLKAPVRASQISLSR